MLFSQSDSLVLLAATMSEMNEGQACGHSWCGRGGRRLSTPLAALVCPRTQGREVRWAVSCAGASPA